MSDRPGRVDGMLSNLPGLGPTLVLFRATCHFKTGSLGPNRVLDITLLQLHATATHPPSATAAVKARKDEKCLDLNCCVMPPIPTRLTICLLNLQAKRHENAMLTAY
ncbi:hypothetical protein IAQ61_004502 [Plenodomus lingam]|uniref:uncharacterized protein n=1 Tax=Leptosphaeria maculans TaxID=5022 RepID=UPI0033181DD4|nr:hypothetical protein IAQ61_004502 [Plenodomus lingam]